MTTTMTKRYIILEKGETTWKKTISPKIYDCFNLNKKYTKATVKTVDGISYITIVTSFGSDIDGTHELYTLEELNKLGYREGVTGSWSKVMSEEDKLEFIDLINNPNNYLDNIKVSYDSVIKSISELSYYVDRDYADGCVSDTIVYNVRHSEGDYYSFRIRIGTLADDEKIIDGLNNKIQSYKTTLENNARLGGGSSGLQKEVVNYLKLISARNQFLREKKIYTRFL